MAIRDYLNEKQAFGLIEKDGTPTVITTHIMDIRVVDTLNLRAASGVYNQIIEVEISRITTKHGLNFHVVKINPFVAPENQYFPPHLRLYVYDRHKTEQEAEIISGKITVVMSLSLATDQRW